jgi:transposase
MNDLYLLSDAQGVKLEPLFPKSHSKPQVDDRRVLNGIIFRNRSSLLWRDQYGRKKLGNVG